MANVSLGFWSMSFEFCFGKAQSCVVGLLGIGSHIYIYIFEFQKNKFKDIMVISSNSNQYS